MVSRYVSPLESLFWPNGFSRDMWMILDGARDPRVYSSLIHSYSEYSCLYAGNLAPALERAAPYLVQLEFEDRYTRILLEQAWGNSWGIILKCNESIDVVRRHLRKFLRVIGRNGRPLVFRYYDPRVMRVYLPTCNREELREIFGPIKAFYMEDPDPATIWDCRLDTGKLSIAKLPLAL